MKPINVMSSMYIDFDVENNDKDPKFKTGDHVRISKHKNIFDKGYTTNSFQALTNQILRDVRSRTRVLHYLFVNPFLAHVPILYPLKTPENQRFSGVLGDIKWKHWPEIG